MTKQVLDLLDLTTRVMAQSIARAPQVSGATPGKPHWQHAVVTTDQITFGLNPFGATRPALLIARNIDPVVTAAAVNQA